MKNPLLKPCAVVVLCALSLLSASVIGRAQQSGRNLLQPNPKRAGASILPPAVPGRLPVMLHDRVNHWKGDRLLTIWRGDPNRKEIALTFDDGPHPAYTARLLDLLRQLHLRATFFLVGKKVDEAPEMVQRIAEEGHEVANHTYHHINLDHMPQEVVEEEIRLGNDAIRRACGRQPVCFRPPGGHHGDVVLKAAEKLNMTCVLWTDDPADFAKPGPEVIESRIFKEVGPGSDILLHDGIEQTLQILPDLVARLRRDGYRFITMSEMARHLEATHLGQRRPGAERSVGIKSLSGIGGRSLGPAPNH